jgi:ABC-2 type transport system ATP-binding protein
MTETAIRVEHVSKEFVMRTEQNLKTFVLNGLRGSLEKNTYKALESINLSVERGETFGIIGSNGSGKSTLLKLVAGIFPPTEGNIKVNGVVAPLISLGVGFNPELTGRENVFLNSSLYGLTRREIKDIYPDIVEFSELDEFIEEPINNYSDGMRMRLAFSIVAHIDPDILLIDEVLAVGDEAFQEKCLNRIEEFRDEGKTILFVSHNAEQVREICSRACLIEDGRIQTIGSVDEVIDHYQMTDATAENEEK